MTSIILDEFDIEEEMKLPQNHIGIWWLASYPKSGNTWARNVINAAVTGFPPDINAAFQYITGDHVSVYQHTAAIPVNTMKPRDFLCYRLATLRNHIAIFGHRDAALKTHNANVNIFDIPLIPTFMTKGAVYIVRDPRDVAISFSKHLGVTIDKIISFMNNEISVITDENGIFAHYLTSWSMHVRSWLDEKCPINTGCIKYEDMLSSPAKTFRKLFDCLGLEEIGDGRIKWAIEQCKLSKLKEQENDSGFREASKKIERFGVYNGYGEKKKPNFFGKGKSGNWEKILSKEQINKIENDHRDIMIELGYL